MKRLASSCDDCTNIAAAERYSRHYTWSMTRLVRAALAASLATVLGLGATSASATAIAHADLTFHDLSITPSAGTLEFTGPWVLQAHASADNSLGESEYPLDATSDGPGTAANNASVTWASAQGVATDPAPTPPYLDVSGTALADGNIPGMVTGSAFANGRATVRRDGTSYFQILGGPDGDPVDVTFDVLIDYGLNLQTDQYGQLAEAEAVFAQELFGEDVGFLLVNWLDQYWAIGPNDSYADGATNLLLTNTVQLRYGTVYTLLNEGDAEIRVYNVPEPSTLWLSAFVVPLLARKYRRI